ncbi:hypothetical protein DPX16_5889 [Anabarilius grahami]|uniref:Uncharacterized protein n=1 Tax=Anabarilius grahami TaxID=495550 RepID=A0A3N0Y2Y2_ANAGA|nr:hypothetical protein DPX16_5889 [Anabarilius grahami]
MAEPDGAEGVEGRVRGYPCQSRAEDWKTRGRSMQQSGVNRGGTKGLKGNSRGGAKGLAVFSRGGERGRLGGIFLDTGDLELDWTSGDTGDLELDGKAETRKSFELEARYSSPSVVGVWVGLPFIPSYSTRTPSGTDDDDASSRTWSDSALGSCTEVMNGSGVVSGTGIAAGLSTVSVVGSGISSVSGVRGSWLGSGSGVGLVMSSSTGRRCREIHISPAPTHSTYSAKLP